MARVERRNVPAVTFAREYMCIFGEVEDVAFAHDDISGRDRARDVPAPRPGDTLKMRYLLPSCPTGLDLGKKRDYTALRVLKRTAALESFYNLVLRHA
jgi:hypothetical protein